MPRKAVRNDLLQQQKVVDIFFLMDASKNRRVFGVPVFPGERPPTAPRPSSDATSAAVAAVLDASINGIGAAPAAASVFGSGSMTHWKLRHVDFTPNLIKGKKEDEFERFPVLVDRANQWSVQNTQALIFSCETVTWSGLDRQIFTDSGLLQKSMHSDKKSRFVRGLRVWYVVYDETFYDRSNCPGPYKLGFINYTQEGKNDTFQGLLAKINGDMFKKTVSDVKQRRQ